MATIYIDNKPYEVRDGQNILQECLSLGFNLPYFCWHPAMGSVGACRQCAIKQFRDENDTQGRLVMACMTAALDGARISIEDPEAKAFRASIIEWLMVNHPHDCPVCDEGGECHLQDMTVMTGHAYRRFRGKKRTYLNQYLGPLVNHEFNRCIQCYRCVRFYRDYAGGRDFNAFMLRKDVYFGRYQDGVLESEFSGNLVEVCPTGVFTDKTLKRHYTRKWDLQTAPSICAHCGLGCNTIPGARYNVLRRIVNRYNSQVNGYFLCDRGRYGYEFVNSDRRIRQPSIREDPKAEPTAVSKEDSVAYATILLANRERIIGIGSPRASLEANFALRTLVGPDRFYQGMSEKDSHLVRLIIDILQKGPARSPSLHDVEMADAVFVLGEDVTNMAPRLALSLRQSVRRKPVKEAVQRLRIPEWDDAAVREAVQDEKGPLFIATSYSTKLDEVAAETYRAAPDDLARLGFAVAQALSADAPPVSDMPGEVRSLAQRIAQALGEAERPVIVSGTSCGSEAIVQAAANVAWALHSRGRPAALCYTLPEWNSLGLGFMGGGTISEAIKAVQDGRADTVIVLENDLYRRADAPSVDAFLSRAKHAIVIDHTATGTTARAELVLPAATFAEGGGTVISNEGRAQRFYQVFVPPGDIQESWRWLRDLTIATGHLEAESWRGLDGIAAAMAEAMPIFKPTLEIAPPAGFRVAGQKIARQPARYSGRTAITAHITVHEPKPPEDPDSPLSFSMEGYDKQPPPALMPRLWSPGWNSWQQSLISKFQEEINGPLRGGDPGVRLIEPALGQSVSYFSEVPGAFQRRQGQWLVVPSYHIFGSEELSVLAPGIAELVPKPYVGLNPADAQSLGVAEGEEIEISLNGIQRRLAVKLIAALPLGVAGLPSGLPGLEGVIVPAWTTLVKRREHERGAIS